MAERICCGMLRSLSDRFEGSEPATSFARLALRKTFASSFETLLSNSLTLSSKLKSLTSPLFPTSSRWCLGSPLSWRAERYGRRCFHVSLVLRDSGPVILSKRARGTPLGIPVSLGALHCQRIHPIRTQLLSHTSSL